jgi:hypothetical protein
MRRLDSSLSFDLAHLFASLQTTRAAYHGPTRAVVPVDLFADDLELDSPIAQTAVQVLCGILIAVALVLLCCVVYFRRAAAIVHSTFSFSIYICVGAILAYVSVIVSPKCAFALLLLSCSTLSICLVVTSNNRSKHFLLPTQFVNRGFSFWVQLTFWCMAQL